jgi:hypothetical protein
MMIATDEMKRVELELRDAEPNMRFSFGCFTADGAGRDPMRTSRALVTAKSVKSMDFPASSSLLNADIGGLVMVTSGGSSGNPEGILLFRTPSFSGCTFWSLFAELSFVSFESEVDRPTEDVDPEPDDLLFRSWKLSDDAIKAARNRDTSSN